MYVCIWMYVNISYNYVIFINMHKNGHLPPLGGAQENRSGWRAMKASIMAMFSRAIALFRRRIVCFALNAISARTYAYINMLAKTYKHYCFLYYYHHYYYYYRYYYYHLS